MTKKGSKNDVLAPPFWGDTGQNGQKPPFLAPGGGLHTPKFGGGPPPRARIGAFLDFLGCRCFLENVQTSFAEICTNMFWQFLRDYFVKDLWKICSEILQKRWWQIDRWLDRLLENILWKTLWKTLCKIWSVTDRQLIDYFVRDLWKTHLTKIFERHQRIKKFTRCVDEKMSTRCVKFLRTQISNCSRRTQVSIRNRSPIGACDLKYDS